ncbi:Glycosyl hydrolase catalytic core [Micromonospora chaiyaphumensis]|uniref:Glycosyl hydrolase catalytic core n=1 Tax=Micromonospora chaiyaphumensis TaxID=307119 RepID=A0A1C4W4X2_9ACTN|nr:Glycosyl hydrolase catalytic core [Micromonospora chaiyaphumensis]
MVGFSRHASRTAPARMLASLCAAVVAVATFGWISPAAEARGASHRQDLRASSASLFAVNIDPSNEAAWQQTPPTRLADEGFRGVRFVSRQWIQPRIDELKQAGLRVLAVVTDESGGYVPWNADYLQIGNEPDLPGTYLSPSEYADLWVLYRNTYPQFAGRFVMAGLASGGQNAVNYAAAVFAAIGGRAPLPDIVAIHPYAKTSAQAAGDFDLMWNAVGRPVVATEWHNEDDTWNFQCMLAGRSSVWNSVFSYTDAMVPGFGLRDGAGNPTPFYYSLLSAPESCR